ncbi:MAG: hypothetical protein ACLRSW_06170 [Christensenellaceae bacterium]
MKDTLTVSRLHTDLQVLLTEKSGFAERTYGRGHSAERGQPSTSASSTFANAVLGLEPLYVDGREGICCVEPDGRDAALCLAGARSACRSTTTFITGKSILRLPRKRR